MKHDLEGFSREIVRLIKMSGDTGGSGDNSKKCPRHSGFFVPTRQAAVSPLAIDWDRDLAATGDNKSKHSEAVAFRVPGVPTATTYFRVAQPMETGESVPEEWHAILAGLKRSDPADWLSREQWRGLLSDAETFLTRWGSAAHLLGWSSLDLFGVHPIAPAARFDVMGLIPILNGAEVVALTGQTATIRRVSSAVQTYRRPNHSRAIVLPVDRGAAAVTSSNLQK